MSVGEQTPLAVCHQPAMVQAHVMVCGGRDSGGRQVHTDDIPAEPEGQGGLVPPHQSPGAPQPLQHRHDVSSPPQCCRQRLAIILMLRNLQAIKHLTCAHCTSLFKGRSCE